jgi:hypothetical protein
MSRRRRQANAAWRITGRWRAVAVTVVKIFREGIKERGIKASRRDGDHDSPR